MCLTNQPELVWPPEGSTATTLANGAARAATTPAVGAQHRFVGYEQLAVLVIFERHKSATPVGQKARMIAEVLVAV